MHTDLKIISQILQEDGKGKVCAESVPSVTDMSSFGHDNKALHESGHAGEEPTTLSTLPHASQLLYIL